MERKHVTALVFGLIVGTCVIFMMIKLAHVIQAAQQVPHH